MKRQGLFRLVMMIKYHSRSGHVTTYLISFLKHGPKQSLLAYSYVGSSPLRVPLTPPSFPIVRYPCLLPSFSSSLTSFPFPRCRLAVLPVL